MRLVEVSEIKNIAEYELVRPAWRPQIMALKDRRRICLGEHLTLLFENHETVLYQIQEMLRIERIVKPKEIAHEVTTYNELIPADRELSATLLIEYDTSAERAVRLRELLGLEDHLWLEVAGRRSRARFDDRQMSPERLSSVQYLKFQLSPEQVTEFPQGAKLIVDHPQYRAECALAARHLRELAQDLGIGASGDPVIG
jgi:hypothetical protein